MTILHRNSAKATPKQSSATTLELATQTAQGKVRLQLNIFRTLEPDVCFLNATNQLDHRDIVYMELEALFEALMRRFEHYVAHFENQECCKKLSNETRFDFWSRQLSEYETLTQSLHDIETDYETLRIRCAVYTEQLSPLGRKRRLMTALKTLGNTSQLLGHLAPLTNIRLIESVTCQLRRTVIAQQEALMREEKTSRYGEIQRASLETIDTLCDQVAEHSVEVTHLHQEVFGHTSH